VADDVFENALVGGGRASRVVFGLQSVDRHDDVELRQIVPGAGISRTALVTSCTCTPRAESAGRMSFSSR
jgi:hypothetical protein